MVCHWPSDRLEELAYRGTDLRTRKKDLAASSDSCDLENERLNRFKSVVLQSFLLTMRRPICTFSHVFFEGAGHTERHLTESALVDVLPNTPMGLHVPGENLSVSVYNFYETLTWSVCCSGRSYRNTFDICTASPQCVTACGPSDWSSF